MKSKLKALGLVLVATLALTAVLAAAVQASGPTKFTAADNTYPTVITGEQEGEPVKHATNFFEFTSGNRTGCNTAKYEATLTGATSTITVTPHYAGCEGTTPGLNIAATWDMNGCDLSFTSLGAGAGGDAHGTANINCPAGTTITITMGTCQIHINPQHIGIHNGVNPLTYTNIGGQITVDVDATTIHYIETDGFLCPFNGNTTGTEGRLKSEVLMSCYGDSGNASHATTGSGPHPRVQYNHPPSPKACHVK